MTPPPGRAQLGMYDRPETAGANDRFWSAIRARLGYGPASLTRDMDVWDIWHSPDLLLAQTCGMPYRTRLHGKVALVGTLDYGLPGCPPGFYNSVFVARRDAPGDMLADFAGTRFAYNEPLSQSGWAAPRTHFDTLGLRFGDLLQTGGHHASARAITNGRADIAALDALTWELIRKFDDFAPDLRVIARTQPTPTLPYITALSRDPDPLFAAVSAAIADLSATDRAVLHLRGLVEIPARDYLAVATPPGP